MRANANPQLAYCDGRIEKIMENISAIATNLTTYEKDKWCYLENKLHEVFVFDYNVYMKELGVGKESEEGAQPEQQWAVKKTDQRCWL